MKIEGKNVGSVLHHINQKRGINMEKEKLEKLINPKERKGNYYGKNNRN